MNQTQVTRRASEAALEYQKRRLPIDLVERRQILSRNIGRTLTLDAAKGKPAAILDDVCDRHFAPAVILRDRMINAVNFGLRPSSMIEWNDATVSHRPAHCLAVPSATLAHNANAGPVRGRLVDTAPAGYISAMCNLYSMTRSCEAILRQFRIADNRAGEIEPQSTIFPVSANSYLYRGDLFCALLRAEISPMKF
jgi:hypothetical protein